MNERQATQAAAALSGQAVQTGGNIWVVRFVRTDGTIVVISDDLVCEYANEDAYAEGRASNTIELPTGIRV